MTALEEFPESWDAPETEEARTGWRVEHPGQLDWVMRKLAEKRRERLLVKTRAQAEMDRIASWVARETERLDRDLSWFESVAQEYALNERARDERRKSITTPYGVVKTRLGAAPWDIDDDVLLPWLVEHRPHLVNTVQTARKGDVKRELALGVEGGLVYDPTTGEPVPGVKVGEPVLTATVDVDLGLSADDEEPGR